MTRSLVTRPPVGPDAFRETTDESGQAAAAILLGLAVQMRGDDIKVASRSAAVGHPTAPLLPMAAAAADEHGGLVEEFPIPPLRPLNRRIPSPASIARMRAFGIADVAEPPPRRSLADMAEELYRAPTHENAAALAEAALHHDDLLVRVAAANAALASSTDVAQPLLTLEEGVHSPDRLTREVAATSLARYAPDHPLLQRFLAAGERIGDNRPARTSMLIHGTWARGNDWWPPGGNFHSYVKANVWPDLYSNADRYDWSGGYSDAARSLAATQLVDWIQAHNENGISLMTHSHGGNVAMLASWQGVTINRLVLLSCPVHPSKYSVNFAAVTKVTSIRVKMDLVLLADGSGSRFTDPRYHEHVLPIWFNHSASHDPAVWTRHNVPAML